MDDFNLFLDAHRYQKYGNYDYKLHLDMVAGLVKRFYSACGITYADLRVYLIVAYGHDSIEDTGLTYNDIKSEYGEYIADLIFLCTEYRGKTRKERHPDQYYIDLKNNKPAGFVKLCDIAANITWGFVNNQSMYDKYKKEWNDRVGALMYRSEYDPIIKYIEFMLNPITTTP